MTYMTHSPAETESVGEALALSLIDKNKTDLPILLYGDLGVGKTAFTRGFCRPLGILRVKSPTYTVVNEYQGASHKVYHFDLYRLSGIEDIAGIGYDDYLSLPGFKICEWSERLEQDLPEAYVTVKLERTEEEGVRLVTLTEHF